MVPWWNLEIKSALKEKKRLLRSLKISFNYTDYEKFLQSRQICRKLIREAKKTSWTEFIQSINSKTPSSIVYKKIRSISGKIKHHQITSLNINNQIITNTNQICEAMANSFASTSSSSHYSPNFLNHKNQTERVTLNIPEDHEREIYNKPFSIQEMESSIDKCKGTSPGPDRTHHYMFKNLNKKGKIELLNLFNRIYLDREIPSTWKEAILIPILKSGKDPKITCNYRPISLTNCSCKILERMINKRLTWWIESKNLFSKFQSGFRKNKSTADNLGFLESKIMEAFSNNEYLIAIFFDLEKAYDVTWRHRIVTELIDLGIEGNLVHFVKNFLVNRSF